MLMVNLVEETKVVGTQVAGRVDSPAVTCAPLTNRLPFTVRVTWPGGANAGLTEATVSDRGSPGSTRLLRKPSGRHCLRL